MSTKNIVHVAVAVIKNSEGQYFIAKRLDNSHQGGLWEFPGGKVEKNETIFDALKRELFEEIGIRLIKASPLIQTHHDYGDKSVLLDVFNIDSYTEEAFGKEGQETCWIEKSEFSLYEFPVANLPIINAIELPDKYMITGEFKGKKELLTRIQSGLNKGIKLIQFRANDLSEDVYFDCAKKIYNICKKNAAKLLLNQSIENYNKYQAHNFSDGIHLNSREIKSFFFEKKIKNLYIATSIHNYEELLLAKQKNVDFLVLSPVNKTLSHPNSIPLGWEKFKQLTDKSNVPVFALGGMTENDLKIAKYYGGQGIAAIGEFWDL